jgi:hypothetical protein
VGGGPVVAEVDHQADVGVTATAGVGGPVAGFGPVLRGVEVPVIGVLVDQPVRARVGVDRVRTDVVGPGDPVPEMAVDGVDEEQFATFVPIVTPRIGGARAQHLHHLPHRVVAPNGAAHRDAVGGGRTGATDFAGSRGTAAAVEPAVGAEAETVGETVEVFGRHGETVEHDLGRTVGHGVAVPIRDEQQLRRAERPDPTMSHLHAGEPLEVVGEDPPLAVTTVTPTVGQDDDAIAKPQIEFQGPLGVGVVFRDPQPAACIPHHRDRILDLRFAGEQRGLETGRQLQGRERFSRRQGWAGEVRRRAGVGRRGKVGAGERGEDERNREQAADERGHGDGDLSRYEDR